MNNINLINIMPFSAAYMPAKAHVDDAAYDLRACLDDVVLLEPGETQAIPVGFRLGLPVGYKAIITPRSGLASKHGIGILNSPGIIDAGYRGDVKVILHNTTDEVFTIADGDRIAQMCIEEVLRTKLVPVTSLDETERGEAGFGSTGTA